MDSVEEEFSLEEQVFWCIKNLEQKLQVKNMNPKQAKSLLQSLKVLANEKTPLIKKRQVMRMTCGDYRTSMQDEMKQLKQRWAHVPHRESIFRSPDHNSPSYSKLKQEFYSARL